MSGDPWKHRSQGMSCGTCMWFVVKEDHPGALPVLGRCRRHAPTMSGYPVVFPADWCGDHKLDASKLAEKVPDDGTPAGAPTRSEGIGRALAEDGDTGGLVHEVDEFRALIAPSLAHRELRDTLSWVSNVLSAVRDGTLNMKGRVAIYPGGMVRL